MALKINKYNKQTECLGRDTMNIREFTKPVTAKALNESLAKTFGQKINLEAFSVTQLEDVRNKLRTKVFTMEQELPYNDLHANTEYQKNKLFIDTIHAALAEREENDSKVVESTITEGEEDKAELIMAARDMVDRVTSWMEDTAEMQAESMLELADAIRDEMGSEASESFVATVKPSLESLYTSLESTRGALTQGVGQLTGEAEAPAPDMGAETMPPEGEGEPAMEPTTDTEVDDEFAAAEAGTGGAAEAGREKRESKQYSKKKLAELADRSRRLAQALSKKK